jgi:hypothetical protein
VHLEDAWGVGIDLERARADELDGWESHAGWEEWLRREKRLQGLKVNC